MLMKQKRKWLQCQTLYSEVQDIVLDHRLQSSHPTPSSNLQVSFLTVKPFHCSLNVLCMHLLVLKTTKQLSCLLELQLMIDSSLRLTPATWSPSMIFA